MQSRYFYIAGINPEPWTAPEASVGRKGGRLFVRMHKHGQLEAYQSAIKDALVGDDGVLRGCDLPLCPDGPIELRFHLWRQLAQYRGDSGRRVTKHRADATNLQKALEDALQGVLFKNDNQVQLVSTGIIDEGIDVEPRILIHLTAYSGLRAVHPALVERVAVSLMDSRAVCSFNADEVVW